MLPAQSPVSLHRCKYFSVSCAVCLRKSCTGKFLDLECTSKRHFHREIESHPLVNIVPVALENQYYRKKVLGRSSLGDLFND